MDEQMNGERKGAYGICRKSRLCTSRFVVRVEVWSWLWAIDGAVVMLCLVQLRIRIDAMLLSVGGR